MLNTTLKIKKEDGCIFPNRIKGWCFPNWFSKKHFEEFIGKKLTMPEFEELKECVVDDLCNHVSEDVSCYLRENAEEILKSYHGKELI